jgi:Na+/melibiose symporter-like transporter
MQDADLFMELAGIAGVFVGFGALIAVRSGGASGREEVAGVRGVVSMAALTIVAALAPVTLSRYELTEHQVWMLSAILVLVGLVIMTAAMARTPEYRANWSADIEATRTAQRPRWLVAVEGAAYMILMLAWVVIPIIVVLGVAPDLEAALYFTVVVLSLSMAGWTLLGLVYLQRGPSAEPDLAALHPAGSTSA